MAVCESCLTFGKCGKGWGVFAYLLSHKFSVSLRNLWISGFSEKIWCCRYCGGDQCHERMGRVLGKIWNNLLSFIPLNFRQPKRKYEPTYYSQEIMLKCCCSCHCDPLTSIIFVQHSSSWPKDFWNSKCQNFPLLSGLWESESSQFLEISTWLENSHQVSFYHGKNNMSFCWCALEKSVQVSMANKTLVLKV